MVINAAVGKQDWVKPEVSERTSLSVGARRLRVVWEGEVTIEHDTATLSVIPQRNVLCGYTLYLTVHIEHGAHFTFSQLYKSIEKVLCDH